MDKIIPLAILVVCVIVVIVCQVQIFVSTRANIREFASFFPDINFLDLKRATVTPYILNSKARLWEYVLRFMKDDPAVVSPDDADDSSDLENQTVSLIVSSDKGHIHFNKMIAKTNMYLCKNVGTNADYGLLQDICDRDINILDDQIHNSLNAPLYIGLAGTFVGIIIGLLGIDIDGFISGNSDSVQHLLWGIGIAMLASLNGLCLTVANSVYGYKNAAIINDEHKEQYFDFLRRELMPVLSHSMASSLSSLKSVLGHFVDRFGRNLDAYADSAQLLNDNLEKQHLVLTEINKLSLARTATKIAETFVGLKDAADELVVFRTYQENLNATIENVNRMLQEITGIIAKFDDFNTNLSVIVQNQATAVELQKEFKDAINEHFPTGAEGREMWRKEFDNLVADAQKVTKGLNDQLLASTQYIGNFVSQNQTFFTKLNSIDAMLDAVSENSKLQAEYYEGLRKETLDFKIKFIDLQKETMELNKSMREELSDLKNQLIKSETGRAERDEQMRELTSAIKNLNKNDNK